jgi:membrane protein implicated in regulation of membrane protease activity
VTVAGFVSFGIATFRARIYPRWTGPVIATGSVAAIVLAPLASVPSGPFRLDRIGVLAAAIAFAWCGWHLLRHAAGPKFANGDARHTTGADGGPRRGGAAAQRGRIRLGAAA